MGFRLFCLSIPLLGLLVAVLVSCVCLPLKILNNGVPTGEYRWESSFINCPALVCILPFSLKQNVSRSRRCLGALTLVQLRLPLGSGESISDYESGPTLQTFPFNSSMRPRVLNPEDWAWLSTPRYTVFQIAIKISHCNHAQILPLARTS